VLQFNQHAECHYAECGGTLKLDPSFFSDDDHRDVVAHTRRRDAVARRVRGGIEFLRDDETSAQARSKTNGYQ